MSTFHLQNCSFDRSTNQLQRTKISTKKQLGGYLMNNKDSPFKQLKQASKTTKKT